MKKALLLLIIAVFAVVNMQATKLNMKLLLGFDFQSSEKNIISVLKKQSKSVEKKIVKATSFAEESYYYEVTEFQASGDMATVKPVLLKVAFDGDKLSAVVFLNIDFEKLHIITWTHFFANANDRIIAHENKLESLVFDNCILSRYPDKLYFLPNN